MPASSTLLAGESGGRGGVFGGDGGQGGDRCLGLGPAPNFHGRPGGDVIVKQRLLAADRDKVTSSAVLPSAL